MTDIDMQPTSKSVQNRTNRVHIDYDKVHNQVNEAYKSCTRKML